MQRDADDQVPVCFVLDRFPNLGKRKKLFSQYAKACLNGHLPRSKSGGFGCPILPSQGSSRLVARCIHPVFSKSVERLVPEKAPTFHATLPSSVMFLVILEVENAVVCMRELATTSPAVGEVGRIPKNPLVEAGSFHQWCTVISAKNDSAPRELVSLPSDRMSWKHLFLVSRCTRKIRLRPDYFVFMPDDYRIGKSPDNTKILGKDLDDARTRYTKPLLLYIAPG